MLYLAEKTACIATHSAISPAQAGKVWKPHSFGLGVEVASKPFPFAHLKKGNPTVRRAAPVEWIHHRKESCPANQPGSLPLLLPEKGEEKHPKRYPKKFPVKQLPLPLSAPRPVTALPYSVRGSKGWVGNGLSGYTDSPQWGGIICVNKKRKTVEKRLKVVLAKKKRTNKCLLNS